MCRLFGFRSVVPSQVHRSLVNADNALAAQSERHPDGWGVAFYVDEAPHLTRSADTALHDQIFRRVSGVVASQTVIAHVRRATVGARNVLNCHPFQHGRWVFAHNGEIPDFDRCREAIEDEISPRLRRYILGDTDSERIFYLFLTALSLHGPLTGRWAVQEVAGALRATVQTVRGIADGPGAPEPASLTLMATDGVTMAAVESGKELFWSTHKTRCTDRDSCPYFSPACEAPSTTGFVNHLIMSSEPVIAENIWTGFGRDEIVGVDWRMRLHREAAAG